MLHIELVKQHLLLLNLLEVDLISVNTSPSNLLLLLELSIPQVLYHLEILLILEIVNDIGRLCCHIILAVHELLIWLLYVGATQIN